MQCTSGRLPALHARAINFVIANASFSCVVACAVLIGGCGGGGGGGSPTTPPPTASTLSLSASANLDAGQSQTVKASGGQAPYTYSVISGAGTIDSTSGVFAAPSSAGTTVIKVTDSAGATASETLTIKPPLAPASAVLTIGAGTTQTVSATGGEGPFSYSVLSGGGTVNSSGQYTAGSAAGNSVVQITDALGTTVQVTLTINPALSLSPASATLTASSGQSLPFLGQNGVPPYTYALASGPGSLSAQGVYTTGTTSGVAVVTVTDGQGTALTANVRSLRIRVNGAVLASVSDGTNLYLGGRFSGVNPGSAPHLLIADQTSGNQNLACDLGTGFMDGLVTSMTTIGNAIYVAGNFNLYNGTVVGKLAKIDATTCLLDSNFSEAGGFGSDPGFSIYALAASGGSLFVVGNFASYRGTVVVDAVKLDATTGDLDPNFKPGAGPNYAFLSSVAVSSNAVYVGGYFTAFSGSAAPYLAKLDPTTGAIDTTFAQAPGADAPVRSLEFIGTSLYLGGDFHHYGGITTGFAKIDGTTGLIDATFSQNVANYQNVTAVLSSGTSLYVATEFNNGNTPVVSKIDATSGAADSTFAPGAGFDGDALALAQVGSSLYVGGDFTSYNGIPAYSLAKIDAATGALDTTFTQTTGGSAPVYAAAVIGSQIIAAGAITTYRGQPAQNLAKFNLVTGVLDAAFAASPGPSGNVLSLALYAGALYVGGSFTNYQSSVTYGLAKADATSGAVDTTFAPGTAPQFGVNALLVTNNSLYVGGSGGAAPYISKVDLSTGSIDPNFATAGVTNGAVHALAASSTSLYVGGQFQTFAGLPAQNLAKIDLNTGGLDQAFTQSTGLGPSSEWVMSLLANGSSLYVGGRFTSYRSGSTSSLIKIDLTSGALDTTFASATGPTGVQVEALATDGTSLYAAGFFSTAIPDVGNVIKKNLTTGVLDNAFYDAVGVCRGCAVNLDSLTLVGSQLFVGADAAAMYRGAPGYFEFPVDSNTGAYLDP